MEFVGFCLDNIIHSGWCYCQITVPRRNERVGDASQEDIIFICPKFHWHGRADRKRFQFVFQLLYNCGNIIKQVYA